MGIFDYLCKQKTPPKDPNSNSALRGYEKRLAYLLLKEPTDRIAKEIKKLYIKIEHQKEKIKKKNQIN